MAHRELKGQFSAQQTYYLVCLYWVQTAQVSVLHTLCSAQISGDIFSGRGRELAPVQHRKVTSPLYQGEHQINDRGWQLSAGLHASCPIHRQTCRGALPLGISVIFMERSHHFCLLPIGSEYWSPLVERWRETETGHGGEGLGVHWVGGGLRAPKWETSCPYLGQLPQAATLQPTSLLLLHH